MVKYALIVLLCLAIFLIFPQKSVINKYMMKVVNEGIIYFIAVLGLSVILGMGGQVTFSTAPIMGMGAYITAILTTKYGYDPLLALFIALVASTIFSYFMGLALFRLKGSYFAFASIGLAQLFYTIFSNWMEMTGGPDGISKIPDLHVGFFVCKSYYDYFKVLFIIGIICYLVVARIRKSYFGRALASVRDDEIAAKCMGINTYRTKVLSFVVAGFFASLAGGLYATMEGYISPEVFKFDQSAIYLIMVMLGGVDSTFGAFIGTMLLTILPEQLRFLQSYFKLVYGVGVIILMNVMPMGLMGLYQKCKRKIHFAIARRKSNKDKNKGGVQHAE